MPAQKRFSYKQCFQMKTKKTSLGKFEIGLTTKFFHAIFVKIVSFGLFLVCLSTSYLCNTAEWSGGHSCAAVETSAHNCMPSASWGHAGWLVSVQLRGDVGVRELCPTSCQNTNQALEPRAMNSLPRCGPSMGVMHNEHNQSCYHMHRLSWSGCMAMSIK